jgi:hypothetical protein
MTWMTRHETVQYTQILRPWQCTQRPSCSGGSRDHSAESRSMRNRRCSCRSLPESPSGGLGGGPQGEVEVALAQILLPTIYRLSSGVPSRMWNFPNSRSVSKDRVTWCRHTFFSFIWCQFDIIGCVACLTMFAHFCWVVGIIHGTFTCIKQNNVCVLCRAPSKCASLDDKLNAFRRKNELSFFTDCNIVLQNYNDNEFVDVCTLNF